MLEEGADPWLQPFETVGTGAEGHSNTDGLYVLLNTHCFSKSMTVIHTGTCGYDTNVMLYGAQCPTAGSPVSGPVKNAWRGASPKPLLDAPYQAVTKKNLYM